MTLREHIQRNRPGHPASVVLIVVLFTGLALAGCVQEPDSALPLHGHKPAHGEVVNEVTAGKSENAAGDRGSDWAEPEQAHKTNGTYAATMIPVEDKLQRLHISIFEDALREGPVEDVEVHVWGQQIGNQDDEIEVSAGYDGTYTASCNNFQVTKFSEDDLRSTRSKIRFAVQCADNDPITWTDIDNLDVWIQPQVTKPADGPFEIDYVYLKLLDVYDVPEPSINGLPENREVDESTQLELGVDANDADDNTDDMDNITWSTAGTGVPPVSFDPSPFEKITTLTFPSIDRNPSLQVVVKVEVTDDDGNTGETTETITILNQNQPPTADAGDDLPSDVLDPIYGGDEVSLDGGGSSDPEDDDLEYSWTQVSGTGVTLQDANSATPTFVAPEGPVDLQFQLSIDDGYGGLDTDAVNVSIAEEPEGCPEGEGWDLVQEECREPGDEEYIDGDGNIQPIEGDADGPEDCDDGEGWDEAQGVCREPGDDEGIDDDGNIESSDGDSGPEDCDADEGYDEADGTCREPEEDESIDDDGNIQSDDDPSEEDSDQQTEQQSDNQNSDPVREYSNDNGLPRTQREPLVDPVPAPEPASQVAPRNVVDAYLDPPAVTLHPGQAQWVELVGLDAGGQDQVLADGLCSWDDRYSGGGFVGQTPETSCRKQLRAGNLPGTPYWLPVTLRLPGGGLAERYMQVSVAVAADIVAQDKGDLLVRCEAGLRPGDMTLPVTFPEPCGFDLAEALFPPGTGPVTLVSEKRVPPAEQSQESPGLESTLSLGFLDGEGNAVEPKQVHARLFMPRAWLQEGCPRAQCEAQLFRNTGLAWEPLRGPPVRDDDRGQAYAVNGTGTWGVGGIQYEEVAHPARFAAKWLFVAAAAVVVALGLATSAVVVVRSRSRHKDESVAVELDDATLQAFGRRQMIRFLSHASHEEGSPVAPWKRELQLLSAVQSKKWGDVQLEALDRLGTGLLAAGFTLERLQRVAGLYAAEGLDSVELVDLAPLVERAVDDRRAGSDVRWKVSAPSITVHGEPELLSHAIAALVSNATRFGSPGTTVRVRLQEEDGKAVFTIHNHGQELAPGEPNRLFRPFGRAPSVEDPDPGVGLSLFEVRRVMDLHVGRAWCHSDDGGATFCLRLPVRRDEPAAGAEAAPEDKVPARQERPTPPESVLDVAPDDRYAEAVSRAKSKTK